MSGYVLVDVDSGCLRQRPSPVRIGIAQGLRRQPPRESIGAVAADIVIVLIVILQHHHRDVWSGQIGERGYETEDAAAVP